MNAILGMHVPNVLQDIGDWIGKASLFAHAGRLIWSTVLLVIAIGVIGALTKRPKPKEPTTWAQAMLGAVLSVGVMLLAYGTVPHEWLNFANSYLKWDAAHFLVRNGQNLFGTGVHWLHFGITKGAVTDAIAAGIYVVLVGINMYLFSAWQKRPAYKEPEAPKADEQVVGTSAFGRPVTVQG